MICNKAPFPTRDLAKRALKEIRNRQSREKSPIRTYECNLCGMWHLTSAPLNKKEQQ